MEHKPISAPVLNENRNRFYAPLLLCSVIAGAIFSSQVVAQTRTEAHRHLQSTELTEQVLPDVTIAEVVLDSSVAKENLTKSPNGKYEAFTSSHDGQSISVRIYFRDRRTGKVYEVRGLPFPHRPFSDLAWISNTTLVFDRWSQPHYGIHYVMNAKDKKLVSASGFPD
jgi:hypothetical protein